jgi:hypothetical protein
MTSFTNQPAASRSQYIEAGEYEQSSSWTKSLSFLALGGLGIYGLKLGLDNIHIEMDPARLRYLQEGFGPSFNAAAGYGDLAPGQKAQVPLRDIVLDRIKWAEETLGGIPRTFGVSEALSTGTLSRPDSLIKFSGTQAVEQLSEFEKILGRQLSSSERAQGFTVAGVEGQARPGLFSTLEDGSRGLLLADNVDVHAARWSPEGVDEKYRQVMTSARDRANLAGIKFESSASSPYQVTRATGRFELTGVLRDVASEFGDPKRIENMLSQYISPQTERGISTARLISKRLVTRYLKTLDKPLEFIEEVLNKPGSLGRVTSTKPYSLLKDILGAGGNYSGGTTDLLWRHGKRLAAVTVAGAAAYEAGSAVTNLLFDRDVAQVGGEALGAGQRLYAKSSDLVGLTSLNKYQAREAEGSQRLLGVLAFPMAGYLTGRVGASATNRLAGSPGDFAWRTARQEIHELPDILKKVPGFNKAGQTTRGHKFGLIGMAAGAALSSPYLLGSLGSEKSHSEVVEEQRGETEVAVRKGAGWEAGRTDIEGGRVKYFDQGWYANLMNNEIDQMMFDDLEDRPFTRLLKEVTDPYWKEKKFYYDRPYPLTGSDTSGFGPLGSLWGATIGRVLKPEAYMHVDEISSGGMSGVESGEVIRYGGAASDAPVDEFGGLSPEEAISPYSAGFQFGEAMYKSTEAAGLPGFAFSAIKKKLTGSQDFEDQGPVLASAADVGSFRDRFWDSNIGGGLTTTEALRRLIPPERFQLQKVNPVRNQMPSWMPGADYYTDFKHGDPYQAVQRGEQRLPGKAFEAKYKQLEGLSYEEYPDVYKHKILSDVAPYSKEFKDVSRRVSKQSAEGKLTDSQYEMYKASQHQLEIKGDAVNVRGQSDSIAGSYWSTLTKLGRMNPVEHLLPVSPVHKFAGPTDAITSYALSQVHSVESPYWGSPIEDFVRPAVQAAGYALGFDQKPESIKERNKITEYFDKLEYIKQRRLAESAEDQGLSRVAFTHNRRAARTMYGADPFSDIEDIKPMLPSADKAYFDVFSKESSSGRQAEILNLAPNYMHKFLKGQWSKNLQTGISSKLDPSRSELELSDRIDASRDTEGQHATEAVINDYRSQLNQGDLTLTQMPNYLRDRRLEGYFENSEFPVPDDDWTGWDSRVALDDIKLKVIESTGADHHDFDIWEDQKAATRRMPYLNEVAEEVVQGIGGDHGASARRMLTQDGLRGVDVEVVPNFGGRDRVLVDVRKDNRRAITREFR